MRKYTDEEFTQAVKESFSIRETLNKLNVIPSGGNYFTFHNHCTRLNLDISHFDGGAQTRKAKPYSAKLSLSEILILNSPASNATIKKRLFSEGVKKRICEYCSHSEWMGEPIPLELEHVNGNNADNRLHNLKIICPNCHALTPTYRGRNARVKREALEKELGVASLLKLRSPRVPKARKSRKGFMSKSPTKEVLLKSIIEAGWNFNLVAVENQVSATSVRRWCRDFDLPSNLVELERSIYANHADNDARSESKDPGRQILLETLEETNWNFVQSGKRFGVSDNALRKWCRKHDLPSNRLEANDFKSLVKSN